jgi:ABC-type transport system involved in cytochrome bd biosynthesis fused ATPase/permease subunit
MDQDLYSRLRKRMLMFYFAAGINIVMALWVASVGAGQVAAGTLAMVLLIFVTFAAVNFYMARVLKRQWNQHVQQQRPDGGDAVTK